MILTVFLRQKADAVWMKKKKSKSKTKDIEAGGMCYDTKKTDVFVFNGLKHDDANWMW